jgi:hypothetical protein
VELRTLICSCVSVFLCHPQAIPIDHIVLKQSSRPTSSASLQVRHGKAKSSDVAQSIPHFSLFSVLMLLCHYGNKDAYMMLTGIASRLKNHVRCKRGDANFTS